MDEFVDRRLALGGGELIIRQPAESAELPDDRGIEWAPIAPYWSVLWRSGVALARELAELDLAGSRTVEIGCGLGLSSLAAARSGARALATDLDPEALELVRASAALNDLELDTAVVDWERPESPALRGPLDLVLAADVLYERDAVAPLLSLFDALGAEVWLADPGRPAAAELLELARKRWTISTTERGVVAIHRLRPQAAGP